ncbi:AraC family transcriptional regulator [Aquimarina rhabdastrellae]
MNQVDFHIDKDLDGVEIMSANIKSYKSQAHIHDEYAIGVMEYGIQGYDSKHKRDKYMIKGDIPVVNPQTIHNSENLDDHGFIYIMFYIKPELINNIGQEVFDKNKGNPKFSQFAIRDTYVEKHLINLHTVLRNNTFDCIQKQNYLYEVLVYLIKNHTISHQDIIREHKDRKTLNKVEEYLHDNYTKKIELKELAEIAELSPYHLNRMFAKANGIPPHQYLINLRLNKARKLLKRMKTSTEIAYEVGFYDQSHFIRNFKLFLGITPKQYQKQIR